MLDLNLLRDGDSFALEGTPRLAFVHHGFRFSDVDLQQGNVDSRYPSLGLLNLARSLEHDAETGRLRQAPAIRYFEEGAYADDDALARAVTEWLRPASARFVLVGLYTLAVERTARFLGMLDPTSMCIVVGGPHPTVAPNIDYAHIVVRGEGGAAVRHILDTMFTDTFGTMPDARGVCFQLDGALALSSQAFDDSLATIPAPAFDYSLVPPRAGGPIADWTKAVGSSPQIYVCTQSCRARCTFCSTYLIHGRLVSRPVELVEADLEHMIAMGYDSIEFHDDDLLQHHELVDLMALLRARDLRWTCNARASDIDPDVARLMYESGCRRVFLGIESLDQTTLDYFRKGTTVAMNEYAVRCLDTAGIAVTSGFIIGAPHHTVDGILDELDRFVRLPLYYLSASILTPDIGTVEYLRARKRIKELSLLGDGGSTANLKPRPELFGTAPPYGLPTVCDSMTKQELNEVYELAYCEFFLRHAAWERIARMTPADRLGDARRWYASLVRRAVALCETARLPQVEQRIAAVAERLPRITRRVRLRAEETRPGP